MKPSELLTPQVVVTRCSCASPGLCLYLENLGERKYLAITDLTVEDMEPYGVIPETLKIRPEAATVLMDDLWRAGVRPTRGVGVSDVKAVEKHLADMRAIVGAKLKIDMP